MTTCVCVDILLRNKKLLVTRASLLGARKLLGAPGHTTRNKKLLVTRAYTYYSSAPKEPVWFLRAYEDVTHWLCFCAEEDTRVAHL